MIVIRKEHIEAFEKTGMARFETWVLEHVQEHFSKPCEIAGEERVRKLIVMGIAQSAEFGLTTRHEICLYIDLMVILGCGFATDPQYFWAQDLLDKKSHPSATRRIDATYSRAMQYLDKAVGKKSVFPMLVYRQLRSYSLEELRERFSHNIVRDSMRLYAEVWPEKFSLVGEAALGRLVAQSYRSARRHKLGSDPDAGVFAALAFILGHQFDADPMHPWVSAALLEESDSTPPEKVRRMYAAAIKVLDEVES